MAKRYRRQRLTRQELKHDRFIDSTMSFLGDLKHSGTKIGIGMGLFLLIIGASYYFFQSRNKSSSEAVSDLGSALALYSTGDFEKTITQLENHLLLYEKTKSGEKALFYLANSRYLKGDFEGAMKDFEKYLERYPKDPLFSPSALMGIAACFEEKGDWKDAAMRYEEVSKKYPESTLVAEALVSAGRCYEKMDNWKDAERLYKEVVEKYPEKAFSADAETYLALLKGKSAVSGENTAQIENPSENIKETSP